MDDDEKMIWEWGESIRLELPCNQSRKFVFRVGKIGERGGFWVEKKIEIGREEVVARWFVQCSGVRRREGAAVNCSKERGQNGGRSGRISWVVMGWWDVGGIRQWKSEWNVLIEWWWVCEGLKKCCVGVIWMWVRGLWIGLVEEFWASEVIWEWERCVEI